MNETEAPPLPQHVESTVQAIANLHADHDATAERADRIADAITHWLGRPFAGLIVLGFVLLWMGINLVLPGSGITAFDKPPFAWLDLILSLSAVLMTVIILASQYRAETLAGRREQLMLQLAFLSDHKQAKIVALLEELRRDDPLIKDRVDHQAQAMTKTTDPTEVLTAIKETRDGLISGGRAQKG
jgi:uncharacterized membrane protein